MKILKFNELFPFGKYKGQLLEDVIQEDASYITWVIENTDWELDNEAFQFYEEAVNV